MLTRVMMKSLIIIITNKQQEIMKLTTRMKMRKRFPNNGRQNVHILQKRLEMDKLLYCAAVYRRVIGAT